MRLLVICFLCCTSTVLAQYQNPFKYLGLKKTDFINARQANEPEKFVAQMVDDRLFPNEMAYLNRLNGVTIGTEHYFFDQNSTCNQVYYVFDLNTWFERVKYYRDTFKFTVQRDVMTTDAESGFYYVSSVYEAKLLVQFCGRFGDYGKHVILIFFPS